MPLFLQNVHGQTTYSLLFALRTGREYSYLRTSLTYDLDPDGHVGVTGSYTKGRSEDTGRRIDLWQAGLTAKW